MAIFNCYVSSPQGKPQKMLFVCFLVARSLSSLLRLPIIWLGILQIIDNLPRSCAKNHTNPSSQFNQFGGLAMFSQKANTRTEAMALGLPH